MSAARIATLTDRLEKYNNAEAAILEGNQSWTAPDGMTYSRGDLRTIRVERRLVEAELDYLQGNGYIAQPVTFGGPGR